MTNRSRITVACLVATWCAVSVRAEIGENIGTLIAENGAFNDAFGGSVSISGSIALIGAFNSVENGECSGAAYLFDVATSQQLSMLLPDDHGAFQSFGLSVAIDGTTAVIGAPGSGQLEGTLGETGNRPGAVYIFDTTTGLQSRILIPANGMPGDRFGCSVGISENTVIVGDWSGFNNGTLSGAAHVYDARLGTKLHTLRPDQHRKNDRFGESVAIDGSTAIVGARGDDENGFAAGAVYIFDVTTGKQLLKMLPEDGSEYDHFGYDVAISGNTAIVGAMYDETNGKLAGSAYLFDVKSGEQLHKLYPNDPGPNAVFGCSVAISGNVAVVGALGDDEKGNFSGAAYLFDIESGAQISKLIQDDFTELVSLGTSVDIDRSIAIVGAQGAHQKAPRSGSAYLYDSGAEPR